jgi:predicted nucleic acid-binding protein
MLVVIDASVALAWLLKDEVRSLHAAALRSKYMSVDNDLVAPANWPLEIVEGLNKAVRQRRIGEPDLRERLRMLEEFQVQVLPPLSVPLITISEFARSHRLSAYDAGYLLLARELNAKDGAVVLLTIDQRLEDAASRIGVLGK